MSKTNRFAIHTTMKGAALDNLRQLKQEILARQEARARHNKQRLLELAQEEDARRNDWADYVQSVRPLKQGKLFR